MTGASRGFGRAIALRLAAEGCAVVVNYRRSRTEAEGVVAAIEAAGGTAVAVRADVGDADAVGRMWAEIFDRFPRVDVVVSNAAFGAPGPVLGAKRRHWDVTLSATAQALLWHAQHAVPRMNDWGRLISISSTGGQRVVPGYGVVGVAKAALESLTRSLAVELAPRGVLVNGVIAGLADTQSARAITGAEGALAAVAAHTPVGRLVAPGDVAKAVAFLCSDEAAMVCGQFLVVDGGHAILG